MKRMADGTIRYDVEVDSSGAVKGLKDVEKKADEIDITKIEIKLAEIQKDLQRIKDELDKSSAK